MYTFQHQFSGVGYPSNGCCFLCQTVAPVILKEKIHYAFRWQSKKETL